MKHLAASDGSLSPAERMRWSLVSAQLVAVLALGILPDSTVSPAYFCPCTPSNLCNLLPKNHQYQVEVVIFDDGGSEWKNYDWSKITTVVVKGTIDSTFLCYAHKQGVRIFLKERVHQNLLTDEKEQTAWIKDTVYFAKIQLVDGILLDLSNLIKNLQKLPKLLEEMENVFHREIPGSQVSLSVPWTPDCPGGKCRDYTSIAKSCDFVYVRAYDMQLEMWDECFAKANAPYDRILSGLSHYIKLGVDSKKLILGVPWFGYDYPCEHFYEPGRCKLSKYVFKGAPCSAQVAKRIAYKEIMQMLPRSITGRYWDDNYKSPYFVYMDKDTYHEVWYDDPESLSLKSSIVKKLKLRGIGAWIGNNLNYSQNPITAMQTEDLWNALCPIRLKWRT